MKFYFFYIISVLLANFLFFDNFSNALNRTYCYGCSRDDLADLKVIWQEDSNNFDANEALLKALKHDCPQDARKALDEGASVYHSWPHSEDSHADTLAHRAVWLGKGKVLRVLLDAGLPADFKNQFDWTLLHKAAFAGNLEIMSMLIAAGAEINARNNLKQTPLHKAVTSFDPRAARLLIDHGAEVDAVDSTGETPLFAAVMSIEVVKLLVENGANPAVVCRWGKTAYDRAVRHDYSETANYLKSLMSKQ